MFEKLDSRYDEAVYYIEHNEERIAKENYEIIREVILFSFAIYALLISGFFIFQSSFVFRPFYLLPPVELYLFYRILKLLHGKVSHVLKRVRIFALIFYGLMLITFCRVEIIGGHAGRSLAFPIGIMIISALYVDYFFIILGLKVFLLIVDILLLYQGAPSSLAANLGIGIMVILISTFCYGIYLGGQTDRYQESDVLAARSQRDLLTGLYNKISFEEKSRQFLAERPLGHPCSLLIIDFDNFKLVNDRYGHKTGDLILQKFGEILKKNFRASDFIGRIGGDEFMVMITGPMPPGYLTKRCTDIQVQLNTSHIGEAWGFSCSIGVAAEDVGSSFETLYEHADAALYTAKERGKATYAIYGAPESAIPETKNLHQE